MTALKSPESADSDAYTRDARRQPSAIDAVSQVIAQEEDQRDHQNPHAQEHQYHRKFRIAGAAKRTHRGNAKAVEQLVEHAKYEQIGAYLDDDGIVGESLGDEVATQIRRNADDQQKPDANHNAVIRRFLGRFDVIGTHILTDECRRRNRYR